MESNNKTVWFNCPWCPCVFLNQSDLDRHLEAFKVTGVKPNQYDHKVKWRNIMEYRERRECYESDVDDW